MGDTYRTQGTVEPKSALEQRLAAAQAKRAAAEAAITDADREEQALRDKIAAEESAAQAAADAKRALDAERYLDAARAELGDSIALKIVMVRSFSDVFIVRRNGQAHARWTSRLADANRSGKKIDSNAIALDYAMATIVSWNGASLGGDVGNDTAPALRLFLQQNPGIVSPLTDAAAELNGIFAEERKSGG